MLCLEPIEYSTRDFYEKGSPVVIETPDLVLRTVQESDRRDFEVLYTDPATMAKFTDTAQRLLEKGVSRWTAEQLDRAHVRVDTFLERHQNKNPFNAFTILNKTTGAFEGMIVVGLTNIPGRSEMSYIIRRESWNKTYATQAVQAIVQRYLPTLIRTHAELYNRPLRIGEHPFSELVATTRQDNIFSARILEKIGMKKIESYEKWGHLRDVYQLKFEHASEALAKA